MTRRLFLCVALTTLIVSSVRGQRQTSFRGGIDVVTVDVSVRDHNKPVSGLTAADFEVLDNGVPQAVTLESQTARLPVDVTLLLDVSGSVEGSILDRLKRGVRDTAALLEPTDRLRLLAMRQTSNSVFSWQPGGQAPNVDALRAGGGTALYDGLIAAMVHPTSVERRQLIVGLTDGQDTLSIMDAAAAHEVALRTDAVVHLLVPTNVKPGGKSAVLGVAPLNDLVSPTGGQLFVFPIAESISTEFKAAIDDFRTSYVLRYTPTDVVHGGWHDLTVRVKTGQYLVRARKGYDGG
jgi:Ca-activated chloride channel family protein